jgi:flagellar basal body-associated protein FliL
VTAVYLFGAIMLVLLLAVVFAPLVEGHGSQQESGGEASAEERKEAAIEALRELEFDFQTGKLAREDYLPLRDRYAREAVAARDELGEPLEHRPERCGTCGADSREGARFCSRCGSRLSA